MKNFPDTVTFTKSHKIKTFKGNKAIGFFTHSVGLRIRQKSYMTHLHYETIRRLIVRRLRPKKKNKKMASKKYKKIRKIKKLFLAEYQYDFPLKKKNRRKRYSKKKKEAFRLRQHFFSPITKKPLQVRMGKGKGDPYNWVSPSPRAKMIFEVSRKNLNLHKLKRHSTMISNLLPVSTKFVFSRKGLRREQNYLIKKER